MEILLFSSPHKTGFTASLVREFPNESGERKEYDLYECTPQPCIGCGDCCLEKRCRFRDLDALMEDFENADKVIFAFPVYNLSFPAPMKALFDRFQPYYNARFLRGERPPIQKRRKAVLLISCGRAWEENREIVLKQLRQAFSVLNLELTEVIIKDKTDSLKEGDV